MLGNDAAGIMLRVYLMNIWRNKCDLKEVCNRPSRKQKGINKRQAKIID
jgi:hypothetical protein